MYKLEKYLVDDFRDNIGMDENLFDISNFAFEFYYNNGKVDIIATTDGEKLYAFEAKLTRWRIALNQAYRNTSFAHYSYVVLPQNIAENVLKHRREFERRGLGLCSVGPSEISIQIPAPQNIPLQPWLTRSALNYISGAKDDGCFLIENRSPGIRSYQGI